MRGVLVAVVDARLAFGVYFAAAFKLLGELGFLCGVRAQGTDCERVGLPAGSGSAVLGPAELKDRPRVKDEQPEELVTRGALGLLFASDAALVGKRQQRGGELV